MFQNKVNILKKEYRIIKNQIDEEYIRKLHEALLYFHYIRLNYRLNLYLVSVFSLFFLKTSNQKFLM